MNTIRESLHYFEQLSDSQSEIYQKIPEEHRERLLEILQKFMRKVQERLFALNQDFIKIWRIVNTFDALKLFLAEMVLFDEVEAKIEAIPWPKKNKNKFTQKGRIYEEFQDFKRKIERAVFGDGVYTLELKGQYTTFVDKIPTYKQRSEAENVAKQTKNNIIRKSPTQDTFSDVLSPEKTQKLELDKFIFYLDKVSRRLENISEKWPTQEDIWELNRILESIEKKENKVQLSHEKIGIVRENVNELLVSARKNSDENIFSEKNPETTDDAETKNIDEKIQKIDNFSNSKYEEFIDVLLSSQGFHYSVSSTKNPIVKNSKWDGSFASKIARPLFYRIEELLRAWDLDPENISWSKIVEKISENSFMKEGVMHFMNVLKNFENCWDLISIMSDFLLAMEKFGETNYYIQDSRENLASMQIRICNILQNF